MGAVSAPGPRAGLVAAAAGAGRWLWANLFNTWYNALLTMLVAGLAYAGASRVVRWAATEASWSVIPTNMGLLLVGAYPRAELWRVWLALATLALLAGLSAGVWGGLAGRFAAFLAGFAALVSLLPLGGGSRLWVLVCLALLAAGLGIGRRPGRSGPMRRWLAAGWLLSFPWILLLLRGIPGSPLLAGVTTTQWGGLTLTLLLALVGIAASLPLGVLLALGRRSRLPAVSLVCTAYIEVVRGLPLISILFMAQVMVPIFLPDWRIDRVIRALIGLILFTAAYMAENTRGGLQGVPRGQYDAAQALGLNGAQAMLLVVLPQALRGVIPSIVGQFISLFKDTSLVAIVGLLELLGIARSILANPAWLGLQAEVYLFAAAVYWLCSYTMSYSSRRLERALGLQEP